MGGDQQDSRFKQDSFSLEIDPELLNAALSAVDKRRRKHASSPGEDEITGSFPVEADAPADPDARREDPAEESQGVDLLPPDAAPEGDLPDEVDLDLDLDGDLNSDGDEVAEPEAVSPPPGRAPAPQDGALPQRVRKLQKQVADLEEARKAESAELKRLRHEHLKLRAALQRAQERATKAEETVANLNDTIQSAERVVARHKEAQRKAEDSLHHIQERRRQEQDEQKKHGHSPVILELLPVLDHLQMATAHSSADPTVLMQGVNMVIAQFQAALQRLGVQKVEATAGGPFQPAVHEAMLYTPSSEVEPGRILQEITAGYTLNGRLLRASRVSLAAAARPASAPAASPEAPPAAAEPAPPDAPSDAAPAPEAQVEAAAEAAPPDEEAAEPAADAGPDASPPPAGADAADAADDNPFKIPPDLAYLEE